ncbi:MAG: helix-turn-helix domain-containing protein [Ignavibacteriales bacterium]
MTEQIKQVAARIKEMREISDISADSLAEELGVSQQLYKDYESGSIDIPVSFLYRFANKFNIELSTLLTGESPRLHTYSIVRKGKGISVDRRKEYKYENLAFNFIHKKAEPFMVTVEPEAEDAEIHYNSHPGQEFNYLIEGSMKVYIDSHEVILNEGDSLYFDSGINHGMRALNNKPAKFLAIIL